MARNIEFIREEKVAQALNVFWSKGYNGASMTDLTEAMRINKSSLYNSFSDKQNLFKECLKAYGKLIENDYASAENKGNNALEKLDSIIDMIVEISTERINSCLGIRTSFEIASDDKEINAVIKSGNDKTIGRIKTLIKEAQNDHVIKADRDSEAMAHFVFNSFSGLRQSYITYNKVTLVKKMGEELKRFLRV